jgi:orotate phosphoribosyltransferase
MMSRFNTWYMDDALFNLQKVVDTAKERLADVEFDTLVGTGFSGGVVIPALALAMGKKFALIRKETDDSHHGGGRLLGDIGKKWVFVDDFVSSGSTRRRVIDKIEGTGVETECVGEYMYVNYSIDGPQFEEFHPSWNAERAW